MLLENVKGIHPDTELEAEYAELEEQFNTLLDKVNVLLEAPLSNRAKMGGDERIATAPVPAGAMGDGPESPSAGPGEVAPDDEGSLEDVMGAMEEVSKHLIAVKRGLGIVNKLPPGEYRAKHNKKMMSNMNRIRGNVTRIMKMYNNLTAGDTAAA